MDVALESMLFLDDFIELSDYFLDPKTASC